jgi:uncharacterized repeat protein (TIGR03806 family)
MKALRTTLGVALASLLLTLAGACAAPTRDGSAPYLNMPMDSRQPLPALLSATGAFADAHTLQPAAGLIPYELNVPFWSDGARKLRLMALPAAPIGFATNGAWSFPPGTVFVKTFLLPTDPANPATTRRLETRLLVVGESGNVYGAVYKWRPDNSDADLLPGSATESIPERGPDGTTRSQSWYFPSRQDCLTCHTAGAGGVLGVNTRQINRPGQQSAGVEQNQLREWNRAGLFATRIADEEFAALPRLAAADDRTRSVEDRARSYLDANCAQCHRPGGTVAGFDARYETPLDAQALVEGRVLIDQGIDRARIIAPHDPWRSMALLRMDTTDDIRMPPLARQTVDSSGVGIIRDWVLSLQGPDVAAPPRVSPAGGTYTGAVEVELAAEPGSEIRYTLDGSAPGPMDARYSMPLKVTSATTLRARAYRQGTTRSVIVQETYQVEPGTPVRH